MSLIDLTALAGAELVRTPYDFAVITDTFADGATARALGSGFAADAFVRSERGAGAGGKQYVMFSRTVVRDGVPDGVDDLSPAWRGVVDDLLSDGYRDALAALTGVALDGCAVEARLTRYAAGCWIEPHTDRPDKALTHLFYFNEGWRAEWDGDFRVLSGPRMRDCVRRVPPRLGTSVVMVPSPRSWHGVPPVTEDCPQERLALLVHFVRPPGDGPTAASPDPLARSGS
ncbi:2OG-Fe(II) oxygenase [Streptomyces sp. NPDC051567]|uniref:2OG-Fe(II) oxygenase n=1 Tax=Streptomyces sp. NPDC051567 TaxID=3365660 RepID=UPI0037B7176B